MYSMLLYDVVPDYLERRVPLREAHLKLAREAHARGSCSWQAPARIRSMAPHWCLSPTTASLRNALPAATRTSWKDWSGSGRSPSGTSSSAGNDRSSMRDGINPLTLDSGPDVGVRWSSVQGAHTSSGGLKMADETSVELTRREALKLSALAGAGASLAAIQGGQS